MPGPQNLPDSLRDFSYKNAVKVDSGMDFDLHVDRLIRQLDQIINPSARSKLREWAVPVIAAMLLLVVAGAGIWWFSMARPPAYDWLAVAQREIGQNEIAGPDENPRILQYFSTISIKENLATDPKVKRLSPDMKEREITNLIAAGVVPRDDVHDWAWGFVEWTLNQVGISGAKSSNPEAWLGWGYPLEAPAVGAIAILKGNENHIGFVTKVYDQVVELLAGNQSDSVSIRHVSRSQIAGYRFPKAPPAGVR
jgi:uncharacterized protein (TIGR02594 family)